MPTEGFSPLLETARRCQQAGDFAQAERLCRQFLDIEPHHAEALAHLGVALAEQGRRDEAIDCFHQALRQRPESAPTWHNLGVALAQQSRLHEAGESLEKALRLQPDYAEACYALSCVLQQMGRRDEAIARFRHCLSSSFAHFGGDSEAKKSRLPHPNPVSWGYHQPSTDAR